MACYAIYKDTKQIRVYHYDVLVPGDWLRAERLACDMARLSHAAGHPCTVERFHMSDVGKQVLSTAHEAPQE
jgi:hypothetical protein